MFLRFDVVDAVHVQEGVLVVVGDQSFHLGRVHAAVGLGDVDDRHVQVGEDVGAHARGGEDAAQGDGDHGHHDGFGPVQSEIDRVHRRCLSKCGDVSRQLPGTEGGNKKTALRRLKRINSHRPCRLSRSYQSERTVIGELHPHHFLVWLVYPGIAPGKLANICFIGKIGRGIKRFFELCFEPRRMIQA